MTEQAVNKFVGRGVVSDEFRKKLVNLEMTPEEIAAVDSDLDLKDLNAIKMALLFNPGDFTGFSAEITRYLDFRYRGAKPAGDNLPISV